jgi:hypothetical protein
MRRRAGHTLVELVATMGIVAVLSLSIGSAMLLTARAVPDPRGPFQSTISAGAALDLLISELESAITITELTGRSIAFTIADRDGDGRPERLRYAWSGTAGDPLTRHYNGIDTEMLTGEVAWFELAPAYERLVETYDGIAVEQGAETVLVERYSNTALSEATASSTAWVAQHFAPALPADAVAWRPTRVKFRARGIAGGNALAVEMRPVDSALRPGDVVLEQALIAASSLGSQYSWVDAHFTRMGRFPRGADLCVLMRSIEDGNAGTIRTNLGRGLFTTADAGASWAYQGDRSVLCQLYGRLSTAGPRQQLSVRQVMYMGVGLRVGAEGNPAVQAGVALLNRPQVLARLWEAEFDADPTAIDLDADGAGDWAVRGGSSFNPAWLAGGVWRTTSAILDTTAGHDFDVPAIVDIRFRSADAGAIAGISFNACRSGSVCAPVAAELQLQPDKTQTLRVLQQRSGGEVETLVMVPGLPASMVDLRLILDSATAGLAVRVNGTSAGTYPLTRLNWTDPGRGVSLYPAGGAAEFDHVRIRIMEAAQ